MRLHPEAAGVVRGKAALRRYWSTALSVIPDLHFTIDNVFAGIDTLVIQYRNQKSVRVSEALIFEGEKYASAMERTRSGSKIPSAQSLRESRMLRMAA